MNALQLYGRYAAASVRAQMNYPSSFLLLSLAQFANTAISFVGVWALFARFGRVGGWSFGEVALFYGLIDIAFAVADSISRGFDVFGPQFVKTGNFDRLLLRPRTTVLQLLGHDLVLTRIGRVAQAVLVLAIAAPLAKVHWGVRELMLAAASIAGGAALFLGLLVLQATLAFWTVESLEVANTLTYGGVTAGEYPLDIYARWFRRFLTFIVPIGCVSYFPVLAILGRADPEGAPAALLAAGPAVGFLFLAFSLWVWRFGVRHYTSTGS
ncbi:MAG TPA: ABC-2 family transporter protein [Caulobacteraceae bacterium]|jgi:ABC-2 type transport system permease protein|nr:ABC-2 family transporter protein [Caulobacteraceae bacterium]